MNFNFLTNQRVMQLIAAIDEYRGKWNVVEKRENRYLKELRRISRTQKQNSIMVIWNALLTESPAPDN